MGRRRWPVVYSVAVVVAVAAGGWWLVGGRATRVAALPASWEALDVSPVRSGDWLTYRFPVTYTCMTVQGETAWVGTDGGIVERWDLRTAEVESYPCLVPSEKADGDALVRRLAVDSVGQVWCVIADDAFRFDGQVFRRGGDLRSVALQHDVFTVTDRAGRKWLTVADEDWDILVYANGAWRPATVPADFPCHVVGDPYCERGGPIVAADGTLWVCVADVTGAGGEGDEGVYPMHLAAFDGERWRLYGPRQGIEVHTEHNAPVLVGDRHGHVWFLAPPHLLRFEEGRWRSVLRIPSHPSGWSPECFAVDDRETVWMGSCGQGKDQVVITRFQGTTRRDYSLQVPYEMAGGESVLDLLPLEGVGVVGLMRRSLALIRDDQTRLLTDPARLPGEVRVLEADSRGRVWVTTDDGSWLCHDGMTWHRPRPWTRAGWEPVVGPIHLDADRAGRLYLAEAPRNLRFFDGDRWFDYAVHPALAEGAEITDLACVTWPTVWLAATDGAHVYDTQQWRRCADNQGPSARLSCVAVDGRWRPWFGSQDSDVVFMLNRGRWGQLRVNMPGDSVSALAVDRHGWVWIGGHKSGLRVYHGRAWTSVTAAEGLAGNKVQALACDRRGRVFVGTDRGLSMWARGRWHTFTREDGLADDDVTDVVVDARGRVWANTARGISMWAGAAGRPR